MADWRRDIAEPTLAAMKDPVAGKAQAAKLIDNVKQLMSRAATLNVPLKVDSGTGNNWDEAH